jgi:hypothetical protein
MSINIGSILQGSIISILPLLVPDSGAIINDVTDLIKNGATPEKIKSAVHDAVTLAKNYTPDKVDAVLDAFDKCFDAAVDLEQAIIAAK